MSIFKKLSKLFAVPSSESAYTYWVMVKCKRCGEIIRSRVDLRNDLSVEYGEGQGSSTYFCRKGLLGQGHCFQQIEIELTFDSNRQMVNREIKGGEFVD